MGGLIKLVAMDSMRNITAAATIALFLLLLHSPAPAASREVPDQSASPAPSQKLVDAVCGKLKKKQEDCRSAFEADPRSQSAPNLKALTVIALEIAKANATSSVAFVDKMGNDTNTPAALRPALKPCREAYEYAASYFDRAGHEVEAEDYSAASYDSTIATDGVGFKCKPALAETKLDVPSLKARNDYVYLFSFVAGAAIDLIQH